MNFKMLSKVKLFAAFLLTGILFVSFLNVSAQETNGKIKVSPKEAKAIEKIEKAKTIGEKMQMTSAFMKEFPQSPARQQVVDYAAAQITQLTDDSQVIQQGNTYLTIFTQPEDADLILPSMVYSYIQLKRLKEAFDAGAKISGASSRRCYDAASSGGRRFESASDGNQGLRGGGS